MKTLILLIAISIVLPVAAVQGQMMNAWQQQQLLNQQQALLNQQQQNWTQQQMLYEMQQRNTYPTLPQATPCNPLNSFIQGFQQGQRLR